MSKHQRYTSKQLAMLKFVLQLEESHLNFLILDGKDDFGFYGSSADNGMGEFVYDECLAAGIDLDDDNGECLKATSVEICQYNIMRIKKAIGAS